MQFLADQNVANSTIGIVKNLGYRIETLKEHGLQESVDEEVLELAIKNHQTLITFDQDFSNIIAYPPNEHSGVIVLRIPSQLPKLVNETLKEFLTKVDFEIAGKLVILETGRFRVRE